jgi:hypothetical protein
MSAKNLQLAHFLTNGLGKHYDFHRIGVLTYAAAHVSYHFARCWNISTEEIMLDNAFCLYAALIQYKKNDCGLVIVADNTDNNEFKQGETPYELAVYYDKDFTKENLESKNDLHRNQFWKPVRDYISFKQNFPVEQEKTHLYNFEGSLKQKIRTYDKNFNGVAALL